jgi:hypothetical protein
LRVLERLGHDLRETRDTTGTCADVCVNGNDPDGFDMDSWDAAGDPADGAERGEKQMVFIAACIVVFWFCCAVLATVFGD